MSKIHFNILYSGGEWIIQAVGTFIDKNGERKQCATHPDQSPIKSASWLRQKKKEHRSALKLFMRNQ